MQEYVRVPSKHQREAPYAAHRAHGLRVAAQIGRMAPLVYAPTSVWSPLAMSFTNLWTTASASL